MNKQGSEQDFPEVVDPEKSSLSEITKSEIDIQIATAKKFPRSIQTFRQEALTMATQDKQIAASCFYKLRREGRNGPTIIEGPSVRLAEIVASAWGNIRFGARIIAETRTEVTAQGVAYDLEKNVSNSIEVSRRITTKTGQRYGADMIQVTKNAACSIALRNAIFKTIPFTYAKEIFEEAKKTAVGKQETIAYRRQEIIKLIKQLGVEEGQILKAIDVPSVEDIGLTEIELLIGMFNAVKDGDSTVEEQFIVSAEKSEIKDPFQGYDPSKAQPVKQPVKPLESSPGSESNPADFDRIQLEIEKHLESKGKSPTLIFKYAQDIYGRPLAILTMSEMLELKRKIFNGEI